MTNHRRAVIALSLLFAPAVGCTHSTAVTQTPVITKGGTPTPEAEQAPRPAVTAASHFAAGQLAESQGDLDRAAAQYRSAVGQDSKLADALFRLGMILTAERKPDAPAVWQQYVTAVGGTASSYSDLGFALDLADRPAEAEAAFRKGIAADPRCEPCRVNYARLLARTGRMDAAAAQLSAVLTPAEVQFDLGSIAEAKGDLAGAQSQYRKALQIDPDLSDAKARLAAIN